MANLETRVDALERQNRWLRRGLAVAALSGLGLTLLGAAPKSDELRLQKLVIVDAEGKQRAVLGTEGGGAMLVFSSSDEKRALTIGSGVSGSLFVSIIGEEREKAERTRFSVINDKGDETYLSMFDFAGNKRVFLTPGIAQMKFAATLALSDAKADPKVLLAVTPGGQVLKGLGK
jgi:hypothetical protein